MRHGVSAFCLKNQTPASRDIEEYHLPFQEENLGLYVCPVIISENYSSSTGQSPNLQSKHTSHREKRGHSYLLHCIQNTVFFLWNAFEFVPKWELEKYTTYKYVCFHHRSLEYKLHLDKPQVSICLCKLQLDDLNCSPLQEYKTNIERTVFRVLSQESV